MNTMQAPPPRGRGAKRNQRPRVWVRMFRRQYWEKVATGEKHQTVRPRPKRPQDRPAVGDLIDCRGWTGRPYNSPQQKLRGRAIVRAVRDVTIGPDGITLDGIRLTPAGADQFAKHDGFECWADFREFFQTTHGLPFEGIGIFW